MLLRAGAESPAPRPASVVPATAPDFVTLATARHSVVLESRTFFVPARRNRRGRFTMDATIGEPFPPTMKKTILFTAAVTAALISPWAAAQGAPAGDAAKGRQKTQMCTGCHGIEGWRTAFPEVYHVPRIGGQHEAYLVKALQEYKSGERGHPSMRAIAASLSDQDMADLAAYYAQGGVKTASK